MKIRKNNLGKKELELAKSVARTVWLSYYQDSTGYIDEKLEKNDLVNTEDPYNIWFFWNQFDYKNKKVFMDILAIIKMKEDGSAADKLYSFLLPHAKFEEEMGEIYE